MAAVFGRGAESAGESRIGQHAMSLHFEFQLAFNFVEPLPSPVIEAMEFLTGQRTEPPDNWPNPDDGFVRSDDARFPKLSALAQGELNCGDAVCSFRRVFRYRRAGQEHHQHTLHFRCLWHDDDFYHTWWRLVPWLAKYSDADGCVGYYKEEYEQHPTLIYFRQGRVFVHEVTASPISISDGQPW
jgi:hypothetical protein